MIYLSQVHVLLQMTISDRRSNLLFFACFIRENMCSQIYVLQNRDYPCSIFLTWETYQNSGIDRGGGTPGVTIWLIYLVPIIYLDRKPTQFSAKTFFWSSLLDQKPTQFLVKTLFFFGFHILLDMR